MTTVAMPGLHRAVVTVFARVGARNETRRTSGLSHLVEHMIFRGTERYPDATSFAIAIERIGGSLHAETGLDASLYQVSIPPEEVLGAIELLGEVFRAPRFADLEIEKRIIREEILEDHDETGHDVNVDNVARAAAWPNHPLGFRITGPPENVERFDLRDVRGHFARFYGACNLVVCAAGDIEAGRVRAAVTRAFGRLARGKPSRVRPPTDGQRLPRFAFVQSPGSQTSIEAFVRAIPESDPDYLALVLLTRVLDDGLSTRLHRRIIDELGLAYFVSAGLEAFSDAGAFEVQAQVAHDNAPRMLVEVLRLFQDLRARPVGADELDKAKRRYQWDLLVSLDDPDTMAAWFGGAEFFREPETFAQRSARIDRVTQADLQRAANRVLDRRRLTVAVVGDLRRGRLRELRRLALSY
ncbi:MAG: pitrilysin family protein, partial [Myxococcota bacterium]